MNMTVQLQTDDEGYLGRECPTCEKYFKVRLGTGLSGEPNCYCPYCSHVGEHNTFFTKQQIEYATSAAMNQLSGMVLGSLRKLERKPDRNAFLSIGISVKGQPTPITYYSELELEERVTCSVCTLEYTIYGAFGYCPDCGVHNSQQILLANFDVVTKMLELAQGADALIKLKLIENALEDTVSTFDGFGREHCQDLPYKISFQNPEAARLKLEEGEGLDITAGLSVAEWTFVREQFQKRHLLAHTLGVVDEDFVRKTGSTIPAGRKVPITEEDVRLLIGLLKTVAANLCAGVSRRPVIPA